MPFDRLLKKNGAGVEVPIKIGGTQSDVEVWRGYGQVGLGHRGAAQEPGPAGVGTEALRRGAAVGLQLVRGRIRHLPLLLSEDGSLMPLESQVSSDPSSVPPSPAAAEPEPAPTSEEAAAGAAAPVWLQRLSLFVLVLFCVYLGVLVMILPWWTRVWDHNLFIRVASGVGRGAAHGSGARADLRAWTARYMDWRLRGDTLPRPSSVDCDSYEMLFRGLKSPCFYWR